MATSSPVARIQSIKSADSHGTSRFVYVHQGVNPAGFYPLNSFTGSQGARGGVQAQCVILRKAGSGGWSYQVGTVNSLLCVGDIFRTAPDSIAALEFLIGGRVGVNKNTAVEVVNERSVADAEVSFKRILLKQGALWIKADARQLKQGLEIQTNGGVMGIKG